MSIKHTIATAAVIAAGQPVYAADTAPACKTWDDVSARCILANPESPFIQGYVAGIRDGMFLHLNNSKTADGVTWVVLTFGLGKKACIQLTLPVSFETLVNPVRDYLLAHPNQDTFPIDVLLPDALSQAYPCPTSLSQ
jgi:hypothetical protein